MAVETGLGVTTVEILEMEVMEKYVGVYDLVRSEVSESLAKSNLQFFPLPSHD